eukprot:g48930.t1
MVTQPAPSFRIDEAHDTPECNACGTPLWMDFLNPSGYACPRCDQSISHSDGGSPAPRYVPKNMPLVAY